MGWKGLYCFNSESNGLWPASAHPPHANQQCEGQSGGSQGRGPAGPEDRKRDSVQDLQARAALVTAPCLVTP